MADETLPVWSKERAQEMQTRLGVEASLAAARVGAAHVILIGFWPDGEHMHVLDGGSSPMPRSELYAQLATIVQTYEQGPAPTDTKLN